MTCLLIRENEAPPIAENDRQSKQNPRLYVEVCYSRSTLFFHRISTVAPGQEEKPYGIGTVTHALLRPSFASRYHFPKEPFPSPLLGWNQPSLSATPLNFTPPSLMHAILE